MCSLSLRFCFIRSTLLPLLLAIGLSILQVGCATDQPIDRAEATHDEWQEWQVLDTKTGRAVSYNEWLKSLETEEIVYLGEEHYNPNHIDAAIRILSALTADGIHPVIGMEMFGWDGQSALNEYVSANPQEKGQFLEQVQWKANWGGAFDNYEPLVLFAREHHLALYAMNPPKALIRHVAKSGLSQARQGTDWKRWGLEQEEIVDDAAYRARIFDQLRRCHGGGADEEYQTMYEASMVRDEGMAKTLVTALEKLPHQTANSKRLILSYTGGGHIQYKLPVPERVSRRLSGQVRQVTIYLASFDPTRTAEIRALLHEGIADYIWLTPMSDHGPVQRCR